MPARRAGRPRRLHWLGIALLILGVVHVPWPRADFHNIRHHDGPGEVCGVHEHLLRWHPDAGQAEDVALLHWHWVPADAPFGPEPAPTARLVAPDGMGMAFDEAPRWAPAPAPRLVDRPSAPAAPIVPIANPADSRSAWAVLRAGPRPTHDFCATFAPRVSRTTLLQHWSC